MARILEARCRQTEGPNPYSEVIAHELLAAKENTYIIRQGFELPHALILSRQMQSPQRVLPAFEKILQLQHLDMKENTRDGMKLMRGVKSYHVKTKGTEVQRRMTSLFVSILDDHQLFDQPDPDYQVKVTDGTKVIYPDSTGEEGDPPVDTFLVRKNGHIIEAYSEEEMPVTLPKTLLEIKLDTDFDVIHDPVSTAEGTVFPAGRNMEWVEIKGQRYDLRTLGGSLEGAIKIRRPDGLSSVFGTPFTDFASFINQYPDCGGYPFYILIVKNSGRGDGSGGKDYYGVYYEPVSGSDYRGIGVVNNPRLLVAHGSAAVQTYYLSAHNAHMDNLIEVIWDQQGGSHSLTDIGEVFTDRLFEVYSRH